MEDHALISTLIISIVMAFICGFAAKKLHLPAIVGYLMAGMLIGPFTPGYVADIETAKQLAEIGIILLMFGVGLHFSFADLLRVQHIAIPGAFFQMFIATLIGMAAAVAAGYDWTDGLVFGFSLSVASTIVLLRALEQHSLLQSESGKIAVGWLIVEDIAMVLALVLLPVLGEMARAEVGYAPSDILRETLAVFLKIGGFFALMLVVGRRVLPPLLVAIAQSHSRELTTLGALAIALGFAYLAYAAFDASFALGAFLAGLVLSESKIGYKAAEQSLPMRDAFAVLFFVAVGMLFDPMTLFKYPLLVIMTLAVIVLGKSLAAMAITFLFHQKREINMTIAFSLAQIGEFSFIFGSMAVAQGLMHENLYNIILAGALLSIALNPFLFAILDRQLGRCKAAGHLGEDPPDA